VPPPNSWRLSKPDASSKQSNSKWPRRRHQAENIIEESQLSKAFALNDHKWKIRFFEYPRATVYDVVAKYSASEQSNKSFSTPTRKNHSKERTARTPAVIERTQALISEDPGQSLRKLASIVGVSEPTMRREIFDTNHTH